MFNCPCGLSAESSLEYGILVFKHVSDGSYCKYLNNFNTNIDFQICREIINSSKNNDIAVLYSFISELKEDFIHPLIKSIGKMSEKDLDQFLTNIAIVYKNKPFDVNMILHYCNAVYGKTSCQNMKIYGLFDNSFIANNSYLGLCKKYCKGINMVKINKPVCLNTTLEHIQNTHNGNIVFQGFYERIVNKTNSVDNLQSFNIPSILTDISKSTLSDDDKTTLIELMRNRLLAIENNLENDLDCQND